MDVLFAFILVAISSGAAYFISSSFWKTVHAKTDKSGDGGSPRGGTLSAGSGLIVSLLLSSYVFKHLIASPDVLGTATLVAIVVSTVAGLIPVFSTK
ncbi:MAG: hypothetical protein IT343_08570 [Candidatus Melainabacteria bacterium]|jgi:hypothetical protein|nr:hypothetical protein [Candidatus Melainabacteria bacterium]